MPFRESNARVTATVDGRSVGLFEERTGGDSDSTSVAYSMGGMGPRRALGGRQEVANVLIKGLFDDQARANYSWVKTRTGRGILVVTEQALDDEGNADGSAPIVWRCVLKACKPPPRNSEADAAAQWELEGVVDGQPVG